MPDDPMLPLPLFAPLIPEPDISLRPVLLGMAWPEVPEEDPIDPLEGEPIEPLELPL
jgi:hypothetical protein